MTVKKHKTVKITKTLLKRMGACPWGMIVARPFLPAVVSTDPEDNYRLAIKIAGRAEGDGFPDLGWVAQSGIERVHTHDDKDYFLSTEEKARGAQPTYSMRNQYRDPYIIAQMLAAMADALLVRAGR